MSPREAIERAIDLYGSQQKLANAVGYNQQGIWRAKKAGYCSAELAFKIEIATNRRIRKEHLAPHVYAMRPPRKKRDGVSA